jgi:acetylornithine deacetylase/succinyl-diaminopimelate desuccinylase-like protein
MNLRTDQRAAHRAADACAADIARRLDPGEDSAAALAELEALLADHPVELELAGHLPWHETPADTPGRDAGGRPWMGWAACAACRADSEPDATVAGLPAPLGLSQPLAERPMPAIRFAYGSVSFHHALDERVPVGAADRTARAYARTLRDYLG